VKARRDMMAWALRYARRGWHVLPLAAGTKRPAIRGGCGVHSATTSAEQIRAWWSRAPARNIGLACGAKSSLLVVDVDPRSGGDETLRTLERSHGPLPLTPRVLTPGGGQHFYFEFPNATPTRGTLGEGLDVKASGGFVVAPPSVHPNGGVYRWDLGALPSETPLVEPPAWLLECAIGSVREPSAYGHLCEGSARDTFLGAAFGAMGWLGRDLADGKVAAHCPWSHLHSDGRSSGRDSSAVIFPGSAHVRLGGFKCSHAHCAGRTVIDVLRVLSPAAVDAAARSAPHAYATVIRKLARAARRRVAI
jgi:hypothetical protein